MQNLADFQRAYRSRLEGLFFSTRSLNGRVKNKRRWVENVTEGIRGTSEERWFTVSRKPHSYPFQLISAIVLWNQRFENVASYATHFRFVLKSDELSLKRVKETASLYGRNNARIIRAQNYLIDSKIYRDIGINRHLLRMRNRVGLYHEGGRIDKNGGRSFEYDSTIVYS